MDEERIVLVDEEGAEHGFLLIDVIDIDEVAYALSLSQEYPEGGVVAFRIEVDGEGHEVYVVVEDDGELEQIQIALDALDEGN